MKSALLETNYKKQVGFLICLTLFCTLLLSACGAGGPGGGDSSPPATPTGLSATGGDHCLAVERQQ
jgi:hypothetical protein